MANRLIERLFLLGLNIPPLFRYVLFKSKETPQSSPAVFACMGIEQISGVDDFACNFYVKKQAPSIPTQYVAMSL
jgi:hypothetical protein